MKKLVYGMVETVLVEMLLQPGIVVIKYRIFNMRTKYSKRCNIWPSGWVVSDNLCKKNAPEGSEVKVIDG
jgi:hypothetical protein